MSATNPELPTTEGAPSFADPDGFARLLRARAAEGALDVEVSGRSMGATIVGGSKVTIVAGGVPRWGEIWAFVDDSGALVVHRLRARRPGHFSFRGDGNGWRDPDVTGERIVGRVIRIAAPDGSTRIVGLRLGPGLGAVLLARRAARSAVRRRRPRVRPR
jgi:hypothetical protein